MYVVPPKGYKSLENHQIKKCGHQRSLQRAADILVTRKLSAGSANVEIMISDVCGIAISRGHVWLNTLEKGNSELCYIVISCMQIDAAVQSFDCGHDMGCFLNLSGIGSCLSRGYLLENHCRPSDFRQT